MPIFVEWKWVERTKTFLVVFHFWDDGKTRNLRMRRVEGEFEAFETCVDTGEDEKDEAGFIPLVMCPGIWGGDPATRRLKLI